MLISKQARKLLGAKAFIILSYLMITIYFGKSDYVCRLKLVRRNDFRVQFYQDNDKQYFGFIYPSSGYKFE